MNHSLHHWANPLIAKVEQLFSRDRALRRETKILRSMLGARLPLNKADLRISVKCGLRITD